MTLSGCQSVKVLCTTVGYSLCYGTDLCRHLTYDSREHGIHCMPYPSRIISEMLPEINTMEKFIFFKSIIHFEKFNSLLLDTLRNKMCIEIQLKMTYIHHLFSITVQILKIGTPRPLPLPPKKNTVNAKNWNSFVLQHRNASKPSGHMTSK